MPVNVVYPKVSLETMTGRVSRWLVAEGEAVTAGQILFEIENDKAAVEVESPAAGTIRQLMQTETEVDIGASVAVIYAAGEVPAAAEPAVAEIGPAPAAQVPAALPVLETAASGQDGALAARAPNPTPLARRLARENGLSLSGVSGTGPHGRVQKSDVLALLSAAPSSADAAALHPAITAARAPATGGELLHSQWLRRGEGRPVVLIHGFSGDLNNWRGLFAGARFGWPVLALDLPGHGQSPRALPEDLDAIAELVEATLAAQGIADCVLGGHSFGGAVAARVAARGHADLRALCLFAPAGLSAEINHAFTQGILRARSDVSLRPWLETLVHDPAVISAPFVKAVAVQRADAGLTAAMQAVADRFLADETQCFSSRADLARLTVPVRVIFGRQDRVLPFASTRAVPPNVAVHALDGCGHMPHLEWPDLSLRLLAEVCRSA